MIAPLVSIKIYAPNGKAYYSDAAQTSTDFPVTDSCERSAKLMGDDYVRLVFKSADKVTFAAFSYIEYGGQTFFLKEQYIPTPNGCMKDASGVSSAYYSYDVKFVSVGNMLSKATCYRHVVVSGTDGGEWDEPEITLNGTLETMYVIVMGAIQQYCKRIENSDCAHFRTLLATIPANGLTKVGGVTSPNTEKVKLTAGTELVSFSFQGDNIANVCTTIANSYTDDDKDTEWYITEDSSHSLTLHFAKCEDTDSVTAGTIPQYSDYTIANTSADKDLKPYRTGGLSKVEYAQEWSGIAQTIVPFGSERNMSGVWRKDTDAETQMVVTFGKRLRLDKSHRAEITNANGTKTTYKGAYAVKNRKGETVILPVNAQGGVTNPDVSTGIEEVKFFDDIYPQCHFRVTSVSVRNKKQDDDIVPEYTIEAVPITSTKEQLVANGFYPLTIEEATTLSVRFESGLLNGREFEIANKTHKDAGATTYSLKFTIVADGSLEDGTLIPSGNFIPKGDDTKGEGNGDEFALFNMKMPQEYVEYAQQELAQKAYDELIELQETRPEVKCTTDPVHFDGELYFGQVMAIKSELFGGADNEFISRVISFSHKLTTPASVSFSLASAIMQGVLSEMNNAISDVTNITGDLGQRAINLSRRGWRDASEVADMLDSITAEMMLVGNEKYQFAFTSGISCVNNTTADSSGVVHFRGLKITYGTLQHTQEPYINYANKGVWELPSTTPLLTTDHNGETLNADTPYYLYAVVADDGNAARYELWGNNEDSRADDEAYLLLGVLSSEFEDNGVAARVFSRTNGYTAIEGGTITTEQIQDAGRNLIIDFQSNPPRIIARNKAEIIGNIRFKAGDSQTAEEQLKALGLLAEDAQFTADAAQSALDNLQIGGRNLLLNSNSYTWLVWGTTWASGVTNKYTTNKTDEYSQITINTKPANNFSTYIGVFNKITNALWAGRKVTVSAMLYSSYQDTVKIGFVERKGSTVLLDQYYNHNADIAVEAGKWTQVSWSFESPVDLYADVNGQTPDALYVVICGSAIPEAGSYWRMKNPKIEFGNKATDWTPAPEDVEAEITESKTYAKGLVDTLGTTLQNQIDGVVDSYFMEGAPTLTNAPAKDWTTDELKARHEGDTYTNIQQYTKLGASVWESGAIAFGEAYKSKVYADCKYGMATSIRTKELITNQPNQLLYVPSGYTVVVSKFGSDGKYLGVFVSGSATLMLPTDATQIAIQLRASGNIAPDIADTLGLCINPDAGKSWRWCKGTGDSPATTWHWHEIADSDAVRALQNAAKAQDTADGKRRVFVTTPYTPYDIGDLWAQGGDTNQDILKCKTARASGNYVPSDWESASSALQAAQNAQAAVDNMEVGGENLFDLGNPYQLAAGTSNFAYSILLSNLQNGASYTFSCEQSTLVAGTATGYTVCLFNFTTNTGVQYNTLSLPLGSTRQTCTFTVPADGNWSILIYAGISGSTAGNTVRWTDVMIQKGNKTTAYQQPAWKKLYKGSWSQAYTRGEIAPMTNKLLSNLPAGKYKAMMANETPGAGATDDSFTNSCLVWRKAGTTSILAVSNWGETVQIEEIADVWVYTCDESYATGLMNGEPLAYGRFSADGTWSIYEAHISTYISDANLGEAKAAAEEARIKAAALDYLKAALAGSTEVAGGLLMTNVLMLKNLQNFVTAGLSGMTTLPAGASTADTSLSGTDNVLLWGGGTYEEAFYAANNANYYKSSSGTTPITTLIKKDGTGKIGIFKISDTQAIVDVPNQGTVVIDASDDNGGIKIYDNGNSERVTIVPRDISMEYESGGIIKTSITAAGNKVGSMNPFLFWAESLTDTKYKISISNGSYFRFKVDRDMNATEGYSANAHIYLQNGLGLKITLFNGKIYTEDYLYSQYFKTPNLQIEDSSIFAYGKLSLYVKLTDVSPLSTSDHNYINSESNVDVEFWGTIAILSLKKDVRVLIGTNGIMLSESPAHRVIMNNNASYTDVRFVGLPYKNELDNDAQYGTLYVENGVVKVKE